MSKNDDWDTPPLNRPSPNTEGGLEGVSQHRRDTSGNSLGGFSSGNGFSIQWQGSTTNAGATPVDVLEAVQSRLQHLQKTNLGGDHIARALFDVDKAVQTLSEAGLSNDGNEGGAGFQLPE